MAPRGEKLAVSCAVRLPPRLSAECFRRASSDITFEFRKAAVENDVAEIVDVECECCGMSEECTPNYVRLVRDKFCGKWICGLCSEAVKEEVEKKGVGREEAVGSHMNICARFRRFDRAYPVLYQAEMMKEMLKKSNRRSKSTSPREKGPPKMTRCASCIPAIVRTRDPSS